MKPAPAWIPLALLLVFGAASAGEAAQTVRIPGKPTSLERFAAREVRRFVYLRTGQLPAIEEADESRPGDIIIGQRERALVEGPAQAAGCGPAVAALGPQQYLLKSIDRNGVTSVLITGGNGTSVLYAAYRFIEHLGVGFYLDGDTVPDEKLGPKWPVLNETGTPLFELRGIQPFHDFPEGPDWWDVDDYKAIIAQLPKLRMNFIGLHTYPEGSVGPEPEVWIGLNEDVLPDGTVKSSYPSRHFTTHSGTWGCASKSTSEYHCGASLLFDRDAHGAEYTRDRTPWPATPKACNAMFNDFAAVLRDSFTFARTLGIRTCIGTETPLTIPKALCERLKAAGKDPARVETIRELYAGLFIRIARSHPLDYYWFWTPENWTWEAVKDEQIRATLDDLRAAIEAARQTRAPFALATCGWVLGPPQNRALFDKELSKDIAVSCINRQVGKDPVEPGFAQVSGRGKWAIPWLEDDPSLTAPQLWAGRMRRDAFDARRYGCNGLMGIHWRTRILSPNVAALAQAAWDQSGWGDEAARLVDPPWTEGVVGGSVVDYSNNPIDGTDDDRVYQTVRYDVKRYHLSLPNGRYQVKLDFCEPHYDAAQKRIFGVTLQGNRVIDKLDMFAAVGRNKALNYEYPNVDVSDGRLTIGFVYLIEYPCIAGIEISGNGFSKKINCGGPAYKDYTADLSAIPAISRHLPTGDFYADWARRQFGAGASSEIAAIFARLDGRLPEPATWIDGPGGIGPDPRPWKESARDYAFVDELAGLESKVHGAGQKARFIYWLNSFRYMRAMARVKCDWALYNQAMQIVTAEKEPKLRSKLARELALPLRKTLVRSVGEMYQYLLATVTNTAEMGTLCNWEQHILPKLLDEPGKTLANELGDPLPADAELSRAYQGPLRLIVPARRTTLNSGEPLRVKAMILAESPPAKVVMRWRPLASAAFAELPLDHTSRGVYKAQLGADIIGGRDIEYYVEAACSGGEPARWPVTAPTINQTLTIIDPAR